MQWGSRIVWGRGCPSTLSGAHVVEFNETGSEATCCQCALVIEGADLQAALMMVDGYKSAEMMAEAARQQLNVDEYEDLWGRDV